MAKKKQQWSVGDFFSVALKNGTCGMGQIVGREPQVLNSVSVALFDTKTNRDGVVDTLAGLTRQNVISVVFTTRDLLDDGVWEIVARGTVVLPPENLPFEHLRGAGYVGAKVFGSKNVTEFLNAYFGLSYWNQWKDPNYLDQLLLEPNKRPAHVLMKPNEPH